MAVTGDLTMSCFGVMVRMRAWQRGRDRPKREQKEILEIAIVMSFAIKGSRVMGHWAWESGEK